MISPEPGLSLLLVASRLGGWIAAWVAACALTGCTIGSHAHVEAEAPPSDPSPVPIGRTTLQVDLPNDSTPIRLVYPREFFGECPAIVVFPEATAESLTDSAEDLARHGFMVATVRHHPIDGHELEAILQVVREHPRVQPDGVFVWGSSERPLVRLEPRDPPAGWISFSSGPTPEHWDESHAHLEVSGLELQTELPAVHRWLRERLETLTEDRPDPILPEKNSFF